MPGLKGFLCVGAFFAAITVGTYGTAYSASWSPEALDQGSPFTLWPTQMPDSSTPIRVVVQGSGTYDSNAVRASSAYAAALGLKLSDWSFAPEASVDVVRSNGRLAGFLHALVNYQFFSSDTALNQGRAQANAGLQTTIGRCASGLFGGVLYRQSNFQDEPVLLTNNSEIVSSVGTDINCARPIGLAPMASFNSQWGSYSAGTLTASDYRVYDAVAGLTYSQPALGDLSAYGEYRNALYPHRAIPIAGGGVVNDGFNNYTGGLRLERSIGARMSGSAYVGYTSLSPSAAGSASFSGVTYGGELWYTITPKLRAHAQFDRDTEPSIAPNSTFELRRSLVGGLFYQLNRRISFEVGAGDVDRHYEGSAIVGGQQIVHDDLYDVFASLHVPVGRRMQVVLAGTHEHRDSSAQLFTYSSNRGTLTLLGTF